MFARLKRRLQRIYRRHAVYRVTRDELRPAAAAAIPLTFRRAASDNLQDVLAFRSCDILATFKRHLADGQLGVFAYYEGVSIAHGWMVINRSNFTILANHYFRLQPREALVHYCSVDENHRGKGVFQALLCELYRRAFESEPVDVIYIDTEISNAASRRAIEKTAAFLRKEYYVSLFWRMIQV